MTMQAILLCGGRGTRLSALCADRPKILVPVAGRPFIEWQLLSLAGFGITDIHLAGGYKADMLGAWIHGGTPTPTQEPHATAKVVLSGHAFDVSWSAEPLPLGTGGGLKFCQPWVRTDPVLVLNGDSLVPNLDVAALCAAHLNSTRLLTMAVTHIEASGRYGTVEFDSASRITAFLEKADRTGGWVNAGAYVVNLSLLEGIPEQTAVSLESDVFPQLAREARLGAFPCKPPLLDMGTPDGIAKMDAFLRQGAASGNGNPASQTQI